MRIPEKLVMIRFGNMQLPKIIQNQRPNKPDIVLAVLVCAVSQDFTAALSVLYHKTLLQPGSELTTQLFCSGHAPHRAVSMNTKMLQLRFYTVACYKLQCFYCTYKSFYSYGNRVV